MESESMAAATVVADTATVAAVAAVVMMVAVAIMLETAKVCPIEGVSVRTRGAAVSTAASAARRMIVGGIS